MKLSLIIPTYNEKENIQKLIPSLGQEFAQSNIDAEIIIVDDNSPDGTGKVIEELKKKLYFENNLIRPILRLGGWMTVSNITVPLIVYMDRFLIGAFVSAAVIAYYTTPYEVISKLLIIPGAITGVLFPTFSASYLTNPDFAKKVSILAAKYIFFLLYPIVLTIITFANEGLNLWLGENFAENSSYLNP